MSELSSVERVELACAAIVADRKSEAMEHLGAIPEGWWFVDGEDQARSAAQIYSLVAWIGWEPYVPRSEIVHLAARGGNSEAMKELGEQARRAGRLDQAEVWYRRSVKQGGRYSAEGQLYRLLTEQGRDDEAAEFAQSAAESGDRRAVAETVLRFIGDARSDEALEWLEGPAALVAEDGLSSGVRVYLDAARVVEAEAWARRLADLRPGRYVPVLMETLVLQDKPEMALALLPRWHGAEQRGGDLGVVVRLLRKQRRKAELRRLEADLVYAVRTEQGSLHHPVLESLMALLVAEGRAAEAERWAREISESNYLALPVLEDFLRQRGRRKEASAIRSRPDYPQWATLGGLDTAATVVTVVLTVAIYPYVQALVSEAGKDTYGAIKKRIRKLSRRKLPPSDKATRYLMILRDKDHPVHAYIHPEVSAEALQALSKVDLGAFHTEDPDEPVRLIWDAEKRIWSTLD